MLADEEVRVLAREILDQRAYARWRPSENPLLRLRELLSEWWEGFVATLREWLPDWLVAFGEALLDWLRSWGGSGSTSDGLSPLGWLLGLLALALVGVGLYAVTAAVRRRLIDPEVRVAGPLAAPPHRLLLAEARALAERGHLLAAAHKAQLAALQLLLERRWLELERSDPNRTLRRRLAEAELPAAERDEFVMLLDRLEGHWFRDRVEDRDLYLSWCRLHERLDGLVVPS